VSLREGGWIVGLRRVTVIELDGPPRRAVGWLMGGGLMLYEHTDAAFNRPTPLGFPLILAFRVDVT